MDDPIIMEYVKENVANVFATDSIISLLMCSTRTIYPWDIVVTKDGDKIFLDRREENNDFFLLSVNESSPEAPSSKDTSDINGKFLLSREATFIDLCFSQQATSSENPHTKPLVTFDQNPNIKDNSVAECAYFYKVWDLGDDIKILIRSEANAAVQVKGDEEDYDIANVHTLNEFDPKSTEWKKKLDGQRGAVFARELKNNSGKISRWAVESYLAEAQRTVLGFVTRSKERDRENHLVLGVQPIS